jgi:hypothetical protein
MKYAIALAAVLCAVMVSGDASAKKLKIKGVNGPVVVTTPYTGVSNSGTVNGGSSTGLTVSGTAAKSVTNSGTITGSTGISVTGSGSSTVVNTGTISATSSSGRAVGISMSN